MCGGVLFLQEKRQGEQNTDGNNAGAQGLLRDAVGQGRTGITAQDGGQSQRQQVFKGDGPAPGIEKDRDAGEQGRDHVFQPVHGVQIALAHVTEGCQKQNPKPAIEIAAIGSGKKEKESMQPAPAGGNVADLSCTFLF